MCPVLFLSVSLLGFREYIAKRAALCSISKVLNCVLCNDDGTYTGKIRMMLASSSPASASLSRPFSDGEAANRRWISCTAAFGMPD